jgi:2-desacetyl-2-hydroxyethyl bacteriochlorophyllide A dehydrogenase
MKAVVLTAERRHELMDVADPSPSPNEVVIQSHYCGICGSDLHAPELVGHFRSGVVSGHEFAGSIVAIGAAVVDWRLGQNVTVNPNGLFCLQCMYCRDGRYNLCKVATQDNAIGVARNGGMAELVALDSSCLHLLPDNVTTRTGAWTEPLAVALRAVRTSSVRVGDRVAVIGGGPIGQLVLQVLRKAGTGELLVVEPFVFRREMALHLAANVGLSPDEVGTALSAKQLNLFDHVFECSGHVNAIEMALQLVAPGGTIRLVGLSPTPPPLDAGLAITKEVQILGGHIYVSEFSTAVSLLEAGAIDVTSLTTAIMPMENIDEAFQALRQPDRTMKVLIQTSAPR